MNPELAHKRRGDRIRVKALTTAQRRAIIDRDAGICAECGLDTAECQRRVLAAFREHSRGYTYTAIPRDARPAYIGERAGVSEAVARCVLVQRRQPVDVDHVVPVGEGGSNEPSNLRCLCSDCHREKTRDDAGRRARLTSNRLARHEA